MGKKSAIQIIQKIIYNSRNLKKTLWGQSETPMGSFWGSRLTGSYLLNAFCQCSFTAYVTLQFAEKCIIRNKLQHF